MASLTPKAFCSALVTASFFLILSSHENRILGFSLPPSRSHIHSECRRQRYFYQRLFPDRLEDWDHFDVEDWLQNIGFGRYSEGFAADFGGIGVDGDRLIYLGTEDQLDHIEYQLSLIGVDDESDQKVLGSTIIELVAAPEVSPELLESLVDMVPIENRGTKMKRDKSEGRDSHDTDFKSDQDFEI